MRRNTAYQIIAGAAAFGLLAASAATAGNLNEIYLLQEGDGNTLRVDQSGATGSLIAGPGQDTMNEINALSLDNKLQQTIDHISVQPPLIVPFEPQLDTIPVPRAVQRGQDNVASLVISSGAGGELQLLQDNTAEAIDSLQARFPNIDIVDSSGQGNRAIVTSTGDNVLGGVIQQGGLNDATLDLAGSGATGLIVQFGTNLDADLSVGVDATGQIVQIGNNNRTGPVSVEGLGAVATYTQIGNDLQPVGETGLQVFTTTNVGNISITQTGF